MLFARRKRERDEALAAAVAKAVIQAITKGSTPPLAEAGDFYEKALGGMASFLNNAGDLALRGAAQALGQRGGKKTQQRKRERAAALIPPGCPLCRDPLARAITVEQIHEHRKHEASPASDEQRKQATAGAAAPASATGATEPEQTNADGLYQKQALTWRGN